jgi:hypothetical protein
MGTPFGLFAFGEFALSVWFSRPFSFALGAFGERSEAKHNAHYGDARSAPALQQHCS